MVPSNELRISRRERAGNDLQNTNDLAREAVSCNAGLGGNDGIWHYECASKSF
jgi:hypothetical protein